MEKLKFALFSIVVLSLLGLLGYWSVVTLQSGTESKASQKIAQLQKENKELNAEILKVNNELSALQAEKTETVPIVKKEPAPIVYKYQDLIDEFQGLISSNAFLKLKSRGAQVGTLQNFLNIYNKTSNKVDNDYGESTKAAVIVFQKDQGLSADGEAGSGTFNKMIDWLKKQG
ncbi:MAG TPA: peptidoglycan-binding domain-containing protein [Candidatus Paceibacterota bacterium]|nr:peptidoglycan-binding domain-containing protein [Candidatus Paceibacterota bacterium]